MEGQVPRHLFNQQQPAILGTLYTLGFDECLAFPRTVAGRTFKALGLGVMKHLAMHYPIVQDMVERTWKKQKIPNLVKLYSSYQNLEANYENAVFLNAVKTEVFNHYVAYYRGVEAPDPSRPDALPRKAKDLETKGDVDISLATYMEHTATIFMIYLFIFQKSETGYMGQMYKPVGTQTGLVVVLVQESDVLYLMLHRGLKGAQGGQEVPFFLRSPEEGTKFIQRVNQVEVVPAPTNHTEEELRMEKDVVVQLETLLKEVVGYALQVTRLVPAEQLQGFVRLKPAIESFQNFDSVAKRHLSFTQELTELRTALEPPPPKGKSGEHYCTQCSEYNLSEPFTALPCGDRLHTYCLHFYLNWKVEEVKQTRNLDIICPVCQRQHVPDNIINEVNHEAFDQLSSLKTLWVKGHTAPDARIQSSIEPSIGGPEARTVTPFECKHCNGWWDSTYQYQHPKNTCRCEVMIYCLKDLGNCPVCRRVLKPEEIQNIAQYLNSSQY